jgi:hypothetical protein
MAIKMLVQFYFYDLFQIEKNSERKSKYEEHSNYLLANDKEIFLLKLLYQTSLLFEQAVEASD